MAKFLDQLKNTMVDYGPYIALGGIGAGGINAYLSSRSAPLNETPSQRRRRLLKAFLLPAGLTTAALGSAAVGKALYDASAKDLLSEETNKKLELIDKAEKLKESQKGIAERAAEKTSDYLFPDVTTAITTGSGALTSSVALNKIEPQVIANLKDKFPEAFKGSKTIPAPKSGNLLYKLLKKIVPRKYRAPVLIARKALNAGEKGIKSTIGATTAVTGPVAKQVAYLVPGAIAGREAAPFIFGDSSESDKMTMGDVKDIINSATSKK